MSYFVFPNKLRILGPLWIVTVYYILVYTVYIHLGAVHSTHISRPDKAKSSSGLLCLLPLTPPSQLVKAGKGGTDGKTDSSTEL